MNSAATVALRFPQGKDPCVVRENVGHALDTVMTRNQEPRQAIMHHGPADEVVVAAGAPNSEMGDENIRLW